MIKNRNIAADAGIEPSKVMMGGGALGPREIFYVAKSGTAEYAYLQARVPETHFFGTINGAMARAGDSSTVLVYPGQYKETATINVTQSNFKLLAAEIGPNKAMIRTEIRQHGGYEVPCVTCNVHGFEMAGFRVTPYSSNVGTGIVLASTANTYGAYIHDNYFYQVEVGAAMANAITMGGGAISEGSYAYDADSTYISNNHFYAGGSATSVGSSVDIGIIEWRAATRTVIEKNTFFQYTNWADNYAINIYDAAGYRGQILDNKFFAAEIGVELSAAVAINNPVAVGGDVMIDGDTFVNYASADTMITSRTAECLGVNYANATIIAVAG